MSDPVTNVEIEDVLSSIRRLVSEDARVRPVGWRADPVEPAVTQDAGAPAPEVGRLVLTPALRVSDAEAPGGGETADEAVADAEPVQDGWHAASENATDMAPEPEPDAIAPEAFAPEADDASAGTYDDGDHDALAEQVSDTPEAYVLEASGDEAMVWVDHHEDHPSAHAREGDDHALHERDEDHRDGYDWAEDDRPEDDRPEDHRTRMAEDAAEDVFYEDEAADAAGLSDLHVSAASETADSQAADTGAADAGAADTGDTAAPGSGDFVFASSRDGLGRDAAAGSSEPRFADDDAMDDRAFLLAEDEAVLDEETLREMVAEIVRQELQGALGERITRNVRKLVRREIHRALTSHELE